MGVLATLDGLYPFLAIAIGVLAAAIFPWFACSYCNAPLHPEVTVWWGVIPAIFFIEGLTLPTQAMFAAAKRFREHAFVQTFNFGFMPLVVLAFCRALTLLGARPTLQEGLLAFASVPTTTSMCVMHSSVAGANAPLAAFNAVLGNTLAVLLSSMWLSMLCNIGDGIDYSALLISFVGKMLAPLVVGQLLQPMVPSYCGWYIIKTNMTLIGFLLLQIFSDLFYHSAELPLFVVLETLLFVIGLHAFFLGSSWTFGGALGLEPADRIACLFCSSHKTVVLGIPFLHTVFSSRSPGQMVLLVFPLIAYHLFQLICDLILARRLRPLVEKGKQNVSAPLLRSDGDCDEPPP